MHYSGNFSLRWRKPQSLYLTPPTLLPPETEKKPQTNPKPPKFLTCARKFFATLTNNIQIYGNRSFKKETFQWVKSTCSRTQIHLNYARVRNKQKVISVMFPGYVLVFNILVCSWPTCCRGEGHYCKWVPSTEHILWNTSIFLAACMRD